MQDNHLKLMLASTVLVSALLSILTCFALRQHIVTVDLIKILKAQAFYANKLITKNPQDQNWIESMKTMNASIRQTVKFIAGQDTIVMVSPAIIQGSEDITDRVLVALGLPRKAPNAPLALING